MEAPNPSNKLIEFYREKSEEYDKDIKELTERINDIQKNSICQINFWEQIKEKNDEIFKLQSRINKLEICLLKEKDNNLRIISENDQLKIKDIENKQRIKEFEIILFAQNPKENLTKVDLLKIPDVSQNLRCTKIENLKLKALKLEIEEQRRFITENLEKVIFSNKENENKILQLSKRESLKQKNYLKRLTSTQDLLCQTAKDLAEIKRIYHKNEEIYKLKEISLRNNLIELRSQLCHVQNSYPLKSSQSIASLAKKVSPGTISQDNLFFKTDSKETLLEKKLKQSQDSCKHYKEKLLQLEHEHDILSEKFVAEHQLYTDRYESLTDKLKSSESKYQTLLKRKNFDKQGYQSDVKLLQDKVKQLEKVLYKATVSLGQESKNKEMLDAMERIAAESKDLILGEKESRLRLLELGDKFRDSLVGTDKI